MLIYLSVFYYTDRSLANSCVTNPMFLFIRCNRKARPYEVLWTSTVPNQKASTNQMVGKLPGKHFVIEWSYNTTPYFLMGILKDGLIFYINIGWYRMDILFIWSCSNNCGEAVEPAFVDKKRRVNDKRGWDTACCLVINLLITCNLVAEAWMNLIDDTARAQSRPTKHLNVQIIKKGGVTRWT